MSLVDRWEEMRDHGTPLTIEELCAGCPELAAEVRRRIEVLRAMDSALDTRSARTVLDGRDGGDRRRVGWMRDCPRSCEPRRSIGPGAITTRAGWGSSSPPTRRSWTARWP